MRAAPPSQGLSRDACVLPKIKLHSSDVSFPTHKKEKRNAAGEGEGAKRSVKDLGAEELCELSLGRRKSRRGSSLGRKGGDTYYLLPCFFKFSLFLLYI